jgi:hypothetical protein
VHATQLAQGLDVFGVRRVQRAGCAQFRGQRELRGVDVQRDDFCTPGFGDLYREVAQAAHAEDRDALTRAHAGVF